MITRYKTLKFLFLFINVSVSDLATLANYFCWKNVCSEENSWIFQYKCCLAKKRWLALLLHLYCTLMGLSYSQMVKNLPAIQETQVWSLGQKDPMKKEMTTHSSILAWRRILVGYSLWSLKELDITKRLTHILHS